MDLNIQKEFALEIALMFLLKQLRVQDIKIIHWWVSLILLPHIILVYCNKHYFLDFIYQSYIMQGIIIKIKISLTELCQR